MTKPDQSKRRAKMTKPDQSKRRAKMTKPDQVSISINGDQIKGLKNPSYASEDIYTITIEKELAHIYIAVNDSAGNEIGGKERIAILKDILPRVIESLS